MPALALLPRRRALRKGIGRRRPVKLDLGIDRGESDARLAGTLRPERALFEAAPDRSEGMLGNAPAAVVDAGRRILEGRTIYRTMNVTCGPAGTRKARAGLVF